MQIDVYNFAKEPNSTKQPVSGGRTITCTLKDDCSIMRPTFLLNDWQLTDNYLKWGSRYYWIEDIIIKSKDHAEYVCREDTLATFKSSIGSSSQYIVRSAHAYSGNIIDTRYPATTSVLKSETVLSTLDGLLIGSGFYVVGVQNGSGTASGGIAYYALDDLEFQQFLDFMFGGTWLDTSQTNITLALQKELINPMQYISSIVWFPADKPSGLPTQEIKFGWWASGINASRVPNGSFVQTASQTVSLPRHPNAAARGSYLNCRPYARHTLFCYTFGQIPIDSTYFGESPSCTVSVTYDLSTGDARLSLIDANARIVSIFPGKFGQQLQISQLSQGLISPVSNVVSGAVAAGMGNIVGFGQGIISAVESMMPQIQVSGGNDSRLWYYRDPTILSEFYPLASEDKEHLGRPLCVRGTIQSYPGYNEVENADIDFACNYSELTEIKAFMEGGFYYE